MSEIKVGMSAKLWNGDELQLRRVLLGDQPAVLVSINPTAPDEVNIHLDASSFDHINEVYEIFQVITEGLKELVAGNTEHSMTLGDE